MALNTVMLSVYAVLFTLCVANKPIMLSVFMLSFVMLNVIMLSVVAPSRTYEINYWRSFTKGVTITTIYTNIQTIIIYKMY
jgi:hypothetical protein